MATLTIQKITRTGIIPTFAAADAALTDKVANDGNTFLEFKNTNGVVRNITILSQLAAGAIPPGAVLQNVTVQIPITTGDKMIGPFPVSSFNDPTNYLIWTFDAQPGLTIGCFSLNP